MNRQRALLFFLIPFLGLLASCEREETPKNEEVKEAVIQQQKMEAEILQQIKSFVDAVNRRDIETLADHWSDEAIYRNPITGDLVQGKEEIKKEYRAIFEKLKDAKVEMKIDSIQFPFEDKAVEEGIARLILPGKDPIESDYKMIYVKRNGKWLILNVSRLDLGVLGSDQE